MAEKPNPIGERQMIVLARNAVTKVNRHGKRGVTLLSLDEMEAAILMLVCLGVMPWHDGDPKPALEPITAEGKSQ